MIIWHLKYFLNPVHQTVANLSHSSTMTGVVGTTSWKLVGREEGLNLSKLATAAVPPNVQARKQFHFALKIYFFIWKIYANRPDALRGET